MMIAELFTLFTLAGFKKFIVSLAVVTALTAITGGFSRQRRPRAIQDGGIEVATKRSDVPRRLIYGTRWLAGNIVELYSPDRELSVFTTSKWWEAGNRRGARLYGSTVLCEGPMLGVLAVEVDNQRVKLNAVGKALTAPYNEKEALQIKFYRGFRDENVDSDVNFPTQREAFSEEQAVLEIHRPVFRNTNIITDAGNPARITRDELLALPGFNPSTVYPMDKFVVASGERMPLVRITTNNPTAYIQATFFNWEYDEERDPFGIRNPNTEFEDQETIPFVFSSPFSTDIPGATLMSGVRYENERSRGRIERSVIDINGDLIEFLPVDARKVRIRPPAIYYHKTWARFFYYNFQTQRYEFLKFLTADPDDPTNPDKHHPFQSSLYSFRTPFQERIKARNDFVDSAQVSTADINGTIHRYDKIVAADHKLLGIAAALSRFIWDDEIYSRGLPEITYQIQGKSNIWDPSIHDLDDVGTGYLGYTNQRQLIGYFLVDQPETQVPDEIVRNDYDAANSLFYFVYREDLAAGMRVPRTSSPRSHEIREVFPQFGSAPVEGIENFSNNPVLCLVDYMIHDQYGMGLTIDDFDLDNLREAAAICDEDEIGEDGGIEPRYLFDGIIETQDSHATNIGIFLEAMAGTLTRSNGKWIIRPGKYRAPTAHLDEKMIVSTVDIKSNPPRSSRGNVVRGVFYDINDKNAPVGYFPQTNQTSINAQGQENTITLDLEGVVRHSQAQRLARIRLNEVNFGGIVTLTCNIEAIAIEPSDIITLTLPRYNYDRKEFIVQNVAIIFERAGEIQVRLTLREYDASIYYFDPDSYGRIPVPGDQDHTPRIPENPGPDITLEDDMITIREPGDDDEPTENIRDPGDNTTIGQPSTCTSTTCSTCSSGGAERVKRLQSLRDQLNHQETFSKTQNIRVKIKKS